MRPTALDFVCPVCLAEPQKKCQLLSGLPRFESHVERKWIAEDYEYKLVRREPMTVTE
jgi:hypothetical protein